jgi:sugar-specific transcriptional regulator TrmB/CheY-like chemotaxis protein
MTEMLTTINNVNDEQECKIKPTKILVIDDDSGLREVLTDILSQEGYLTSSCSTGNEAVAACQKEFFDIGLIDIRLPDTDGISLLQILAKLCPTMIKIIITGYPSMESAVQSLNSGADGYIIKPFKPERILEQIREQLEKHQMGNWENLLKNSGLSSYEAKIYLSLALNGCSEARKLSLSSGVPRNKAYAALKKLSQRGIVIKVPGAKQKFSIATPSDAFSTFLQSWKQALSKQEKNLIEFEKTISTLDMIHANKEKMQPESLQKQEVWTINGEEEITQRIGEMLLAAKTSVFAATTEQGLIRFQKTFRRTLDDLSTKRIKIQINVPVGISNIDLIKDLKNSYQIRNLKIDIPLFFLVVDDNQLLLANIAEEHLKDHSAEHLGFFAKSENLPSFFNILLGFQRNEQNKTKIANPQWKKN